MNELETEILELENIKKKKQNVDNAAQKHLQDKVDNLQLQTKVGCVY